MGLLRLLDLGLGLLRLLKLGVSLCLSQLCFLELSLGLSLRLLRSLNLGLDLSLSLGDDKRLGVSLRSLALAANLPVLRCKNSTCPRDLGIISLGLGAVRMQWRRCCRRGSSDLGK